MSQPPPLTIRPGKERAALSDAWRGYLENPAEALRVAELCAVRAREGADTNLEARALALAAAVALHRGETDEAGALLGRADRLSGAETDPRTGADVAAVSAQLGFHTGDHDRAIREAHRAVALADVSEDLRVRIRVRRVTCMVYGNLRLPESRRLVEELLELAVTTDEPWEEAVSRNDLACALCEAGEFAAAEVETARALRLLGSLGVGNSFATAVILATRAEIRLADERPQEALPDAERALELLREVPEPDPYLLAAAVQVQLQALIALGRPEDAHRCGAAALTEIGDRVPHTRSRLMLQLAEAMTQIGFTAEAEAMQAAIAAMQQSSPEAPPPPLQPPHDDPRG